METTIYVDIACTGRGVGGRLLAALLGVLEEEPAAHRAYAGIALPNEASVALHERYGYRHLGTYHEVGRKFDRWVDVAWYERALE